MATPKWFDATTYLNNKLDQMHEVGYPSWYTKSDLIDDFHKAGFTTDADGLYKHFQKYGVKENVSPNKYFDADYYFQSKAAQYYDVDVTQVTADQVAAMKAAFAKAGLSAWEHYLKYGMKEGIDPNANFNTSQYMLDKLTLMQETDPTYTMDDLVAAFKAVNLNPVMHYMSYGIGEGLSAKVATEHGGPAQYLTEGIDNLTGTISIDADKKGVIDDDGNLVPDDTYGDYFKAEEGTLQSRDTVDGLGGVDTLYAIVDADRSDTTGVKAGSINPTVKNVEKVLFQSQIGDGDTVVNKAPVSAVIDADRISLAHKGEDGYTTDLTLGSVNSRADLRIEDVRHNSNETVIRFADADPEIDFNVYFNARYLKAEGGSSSDTKLLILEDVKNAQNNNGPLNEQPYDQLKFNYIAADGTTTFVVLDMTTVADPSEYQTETATYDSLVTALNKAKTAWLAEHTDFTGEFTITKGVHYHADATVGNVKYESDMGEYVVLTAVNGTLDTTSKGTGWDIADGSPAPVNGGVVRGEDTASSSDCPLIITKVELDNVAQVNWWSGKDDDCIPDNDVLGSHAGDLQIGDMSMRGGIERMDVTVDRGSWLSALLSTNNTLRYVKVTAGDINGDKIVGDDANHTGSLYIGDWDGKLDEQGDGRGHITKNVDTNLTWTDKARLLTAKYDIDDDEEDGGSADIAGLHDVAVFDATDEGKNLYKGNINIAAEFGASAYDKYFKFVDGSKGVDKMPPLPKYDGKFAYLTGTGNDTINMTVNGGVAADNDFVMNIATNAGDDLVAFQYADMSEYQSYDNKKLQQVNIDTGDGNDTVWFYAGKMAENPDYDPQDQQADVLEYIKDEDGGAVTVKAGAGKDAIYVNQVDLMEGGTGSGVTWGPDAYNAVFVFNAQDTTVGFDGGKFNGATNSNDIATGPRLFYADKPTEATNLWVKVNFKGFTSQVQFKSIDKDAFSVTATEINQAIINAVENNDTLCKLISAKDGAGYSLIIESLINGEMTLNDLTITFQEAKDAEAAKIAPDVAVTGSNGGNAWYATQFGTAPLPEDAADDAEPVPYTGNDDHVRSQAVVNGGTENDVIVLGKNGAEASEDAIAVTFEDTQNETDVDLTDPAKGNSITVTVDGADYTATYDGTAWKDFEDEEGNTLKDATGLSCDLTKITTKEENNQGGVAGTHLVSVVTFERTTEESSELSITSAEATVGSGTPNDVSAQIGDVLAAQKATGTVVVTGAAATDTVVVTVGGDTGSQGTFTSTYADGKWGEFEDLSGAQPAALPDGLTITMDASGKVTVVDENVNGAAPTYTATPTLGGTQGADVTLTAKDVNPFHCDIAFGDISTAVDGNEISFTLDGVEYKAPLTFDTTQDPAVITGVGEFTDKDGNAPEGLTVSWTAGDDPANPDWTDVTVTLTNASKTFTAPEAATTYLGEPGSFDGESADVPGEDAPYWNTGMDIVELSASFDHDVVTDFQSGVDKVNVHDLFGKDVDVAYDAANALSALKDMSVFIAEYDKGDAITGIVEQTTVTADFGTVIKLADEATKAVVFLHDTSAEDNNVYTVAVVTSSGASVQGSLTLAKDDVTPEQLVLSADVCDIIGVESELIPDPVVA